MKIAIIINSGVRFKLVPILNNINVQTQMHKNRNKVYPIIEFLGIPTLNTSFIFIKFEIPNVISDNKLIDGFCPNMNERSPGENPNGELGEIPKILKFASINGRAKMTSKNINKHQYDFINAFLKS